MSRPAHPRPLSLSSAIERQKRVLLLEYDHGLERGPGIFTKDSVNPLPLLRLAERAPFTGIVLQHGVARMYYQHEGFSVPLVVKMNGLTSLEPLAEQSGLTLCSVEDALELGAQAVGFSIVLGGRYEGQMFQEFAHAVKDAHERGLPMAVWMHLAGPMGEVGRDLLAYAARVALELGADYVALPFPLAVEGLAWVVESAGLCKVLLIDDGADHVRPWSKVMRSGVAGAVVGPSFWRAGHPLDEAAQMQRMVGV